MGRINRESTLEDEGKIYDAYSFSKGCVELASKLTGWSPSKVRSDWLSIGLKPRGRYEKKTFMGTVAEHVELIREEREKKKPFSIYIVEEQSL